MSRLALLSLGLAAAGCGFSPSAGTTSDADLRTPDAAHVDAPRALDAPRAIDAPHVDAAIDASVSIDAAPPDASVTVYLDCEDAHGHGVTADGPQMIDPDGSGGMPPFQAYCDMTRAGGGWTLVWVYRFTDYADFQNGDNAVTPRPTWGVPSGSTGVTPTSTTLPTDPTTQGALDFPRWGSLGKKVLVSSTINHVVQCQPGPGATGGSLVDFKPGPMTCQLVQAVATACTTAVPGYFNTADPAGVGLYRDNNILHTYYFWEGKTLTANWPTHDPCSSNMANQLTGVADARGELYLKR